MRVHVNNKVQLFVMFDYILTFERSKLSCGLLQ